MFTFDDWHLSYDGQVLAMQHDNKSRQILVQGTFPAGYTWAMEVQVGTAWDAIVLSPVSGGLAALLTQDNLAYAGWYEMQLRGAQGDVVRRTNIIRVHVPRSLSGTGQWPTVPSEFIQIEQRIADLNAHPSKPGVNGYWMVWDPDAQEYRESDIPLPDVSVGPPGKAATIKVVETVTATSDEDADVENLGDENAALFRFTIPRGKTGPVGATPQISVTVTTLPAGQDVTVQVSGPAEAPTIAFGIPQGQPGERGPQGIQGFQGWGLSGAELDSDGALVLTLRNPADGQTQTLPPVPIDNSDALQAVAAAITAQGTTQVQRVEDAGDDAVGAVGTAKNAALEAVGQAQTAATGAVSSAQTTAVQAVQDAQGTATTAISQAQTASVGAVNDAKTAAVEAVEKKGAAEQSKLNAIVPPPTAEDAGKALVANAEGSGLVYGDAPGGAGIDDAVIATDATWSSRMIVDSLAPEFSETGAVVMCNPVAGYPLNIQAQIVPVQEGEGDPSPENVRPITGWDKAMLMHNDSAITLPFGQTVYGGTLDVTSGVLIVDRVLKTLSSSENWLFNLGGLPGLYWHSIILCDSEVADASQLNKAVSSHYKYEIDKENSFWLANSGKNIRIANNISTTEEWKDYLISENSSGHPVQILYYIATPVTLQLIPQEILALSGVNTIYTDSGDTTVSGRADPTTIINQLATRIAALESAATNL